MKRNKCGFMKSSVTYLGHQINEDGLHPLQDRVTTIREASTPTSVSSCTLGCCPIAASSCPTFRVTCNRAISCFARTFDGTGAQSRGRSSTSRRSCSLCQITSYILTNPWRLHLHAMPLHMASGQSYLPKCLTDQKGTLVTHLEHSTKPSGITPS